MKLTPTQRKKVFTRFLESLNEEIKEVDCLTPVSGRCPENIAEDLYGSKHTYPCSTLCGAIWKGCNILGVRDCPCFRFGREEAYKRLKNYVAKKVRKKK